MSLFRLALTQPDGFRQLENDFTDLQGEIQFFLQLTSLETINQLQIAKT